MVGRCDDGGRGSSPNVIGRREVIAMTQIKLLVAMPVTDGERNDGEPDEVPFTGHVNAVLTFGDGWMLRANQAEHAGAAAEGYPLEGAADDPPVRQAIECLVKAAAPPARPDATEDGEGDAEGGDGDEAVKAHAHGEVLEFEVPEGKTSVRTRVVPEVTVEDGEVHARVKVDDPNWVREPGSPE
jgi:hypothetical protein